MWQTDGFSQDVAVRPFIQFLESDEYVSWAESQDGASSQSITIADAVQGWLEVGNGVEIFSTYTSFLLGLIAILDEWTMMPNLNTIGDAYVDPINRGRVHLFQPLETSRIDTNSFYSKFTEVGQTAFHPIMQQNYFEMLKARSRLTR